MADDYDTQLGQFMHGVRTMESGGRYNTPPNRVGASGAYQFIDSTWGGYGGYQHAYQAPPEIQDERARQLMGAYYRKFGDWGSVAQAWLGGPGSVGKNVSDGNITSFDYARRVLSYAGLSGATPPPASTAPSSGGSGGRVGAGMAVGGTAPQPQQTGPDYHDPDVQAQTILGVLGTRVHNLSVASQMAGLPPGATFDATNGAITIPVPPQTPADRQDEAQDLSLDTLGDTSYLQRQGRAI